MRFELCGHCKHCTVVKEREQLGLCTEEHLPTNAKGEHRKNVYLWNVACKRFEKKVHRGRPFKTDKDKEVKNE